MDEVLVRKVAAFTSMCAGSGAFVVKDRDGREVWTKQAQSAVTAVEQHLLSEDVVRRAAAALGEEALNLLDRDLGTLHVEPVSYTHLTLPTN